ncbi:ester cyclase [Micromonospora sp. CPCC 205539]|uniref:ester cyclase n=1 Tax=Micromonospora sp. CPCC 205539 TaxID=3122408 RepID=UPI002FEF2AEF
MSFKQRTEGASAPSRRKMIGAILGVVATLAATAVPAQAHGRGPHETHMSPKRVAAAFYASYNGDLAAGFERYISKDLVLHGFDGPNDRSAWVAGDLEIKGSLTGYKLDVLDQIVEGNKVVTRWQFAGTHTGTILGIPASGRNVHLSGISIDRVVGGQSVEHWSEGNFGRFLQELSAATPPSGK